MRNLLVTALFLVIGLTMAPYLVGAVMDGFAIVIYDTLGWDLGVGFAQNTLAIWPGGEIVAAIVFGHRGTTPELMLGLLQVLMVSSLRSLVPPLVGDGNGNFRVQRLLGIGLLDSAITCIISIAVGWAFLAWFDDMFQGPLGPLVQVVVGVGSIAVIVTAVLVALRVLARGNVQFAFSVMTSIGRFALVTFTLITYSVNNVVGAFAVVGCIIASGMLTFVDGRESRYW